ncbi:MAG: phosphate ABC transporter substrate-binding protein PstS [Lentisphaerae bacterium GWF2_45_14]|nr:MAG: phosphate ABC transporter substrate-binding protein PstS [Lentisphaerae bacterium GWF2_45_14]
MEMFGKTAILIVYIFVFAVLNLCASDLERINGAGASFPALIYRIWTYNYSKASGTEIEYHSIGSEAGLSQLASGTVDFAASDTPLNSAFLEKEDLVQFPMLIGGVVAAVNLSESGAIPLKLSPELLSRVFMGEIKEWNHPEIVSLNPDVPLPNRKITVVHRAEGSGTTWVFSKYLSSVSREWRERMGSGKILNWPGGIAASNNSGVANYIKKISGSIGYVEYNYALGAGLKCVMFKNQSGNFVAPSLAAFKSAASSLDWKNISSYSDLFNSPKPDAWPLIGATYIIMKKKQSNPATTAEILLFFKSCFEQESDEKLNYVPLPPNCVKKIEDSWIKTFFKTN